MNTPNHYPGPTLTDESNWFAHDTMTRRIPETIQSILDRNPNFSDYIVRQMKALEEEIISDQPITALPLIAPDYDFWYPALQARQTHTWLSTDWFFAETYFYRRIIEAVRWFEMAHDPFEPNKREEYTRPALWKLLEAALSDDASPLGRLPGAIKAALWGNRIDLSFVASMAHGTSANAEDLIVDHTEAVVSHILNGSGDLHIIVDNAGTELTMDLVLVDVLLQATAANVYLHVKMHPTFVSDAIPADIWRFLDMLDQRGGNFAEFGARLRSAFDSARLSVLPHFFWNSPYPMWKMPLPLQHVLNTARTVIVKGDANYRRLLGDGLWSTTIPFSDAVNYMDSPVLALRTLKSDPIVGLPAGLENSLEEIDAEWRINGKRGIIQFSR